MISDSGEIDAWYKLDQFTCHWRGWPWVFPLLLDKATEEELLAAGRRTPAVPKARSTAKAKAKKPTGAPQSAPTGVVKTIEKKTPKGKVVPHTVVKGTQEPSAASQPPSKRLRGKTAETPNVEEPDQAAALAKVHFGRGVSSFDWSWRVIYYTLYTRMADVRPMVLFNLFITQQKK